MAVAYVGPDATGQGFPLNPINISHTLNAASGTDRIVLAWTGVRGGAGPHNFLQADYDGVAGTLIAQIQTPSVFGRINSLALHAWLDADLPGGTGIYNYTFEIAGGGAFGSYSAVTCYTGVDQVVPANTSAPNQADANNPPFSGIQTTNLTTLSSAGFVVDGFYYENGGADTVTPGGGQTLRSVAIGSQNAIASSDKAYAAAALQSMSETPAPFSYFFFSHLLVELAEAGGAGNPGLKQDAIGFGSLL